MDPTSGKFAYTIQSNWGGVWQGTTRIGDDSAICMRDKYCNIGVRWIMDMANFLAKKKKLQQQNPQSGGNTNSNNQKLLNWNVGWSLLRRLAGGWEGGGY